MCVDVNTSNAFDMYNKMYQCNDANTSNMFSMNKTFKEQYQQYLWNMHCNGDIFAEYWRPFTYEEWLRNHRPIDDGGVKLDDGSEHLETFRY